MKAISVAPHILVVDDNLSVATLLQQLLRADGYKVSLAHDGHSALQGVDQNPPDLILLDVDLPLISGDEVCRRIKNHADADIRLIPILMITAQSDFQNKLDAWEYGADDFLTKPFQLVEVTTRCRSLLRIKRLIAERDSAERVVFALARAVEAKSQFTHGHSERVSIYCRAMAEAMDLSEEDKAILCKGARLHDIGKISIPDAILNKPGPLTPEEYAVIKTHPTTGAHIVEGLDSVRNVIPLILSHHERLDGMGYPNGLRGSEIPLLVRILSVTDVYDSLANDRPYRPPLPHDRCLEILQESADGGGLDPEIVQVFLQMFRERPDVMLLSGEEPAAPRLRSPSLLTPVH